MYPSNATNSHWSIRGSIRMAHDSCHKVIRRLVANESSQPVSSVKHRSVQRVPHVLTVQKITPGSRGNDPFSLHIVWKVTCKHLGLRIIWVVFTFYDVDLRTEQCRIPLPRSRVLTIYVRTTKIPRCLSAIKRDNTKNEKIDRWAVISQSFYWIRSIFKPENTVFVLLIEGYRWRLF